MKPQEESMHESWYDTIPQELRPFDNATPAQAIGKSPLAPWRVSYADRAAKLLAKYGQPDLYVDPWTEQQGRLALWVGLRDNRDARAHALRLLGLAGSMTIDGLGVKVVSRRGIATHLLLVDDLHTEPRG